MDRYPIVTRRVAEHVLAALTLARELKDPDMKLLGAAEMQRLFDPMSHGEMRFLSAVLAYLVAHLADPQSITEVAVELATMEDHTQRVNLNFRPVSTGQG